MTRNFRAVTKVTHSCAQCDITERLPPSQAFPPSGRVQRAHLPVLILSRLSTSLMDSRGNASIVALTLPCPANASDSSRSKRVPTMEPRIV